mmetsp:Transcript_14012/g.36351  ORF Transcript_14012/g.36351 Transcript_14012/m.36351 type:complete len:125 (+) Transcript_14012:386-760(+)
MVRARTQPEAHRTAELRAGASDCTLPGGLEPPLCCWHGAGKPLEVASRRECFAVRIHTPRSRRCKTFVHADVHALHFLNVEWGSAIYSTNQTCLPPQPPGVWSLIRMQAAYEAKSVGSSAMTTM